MPYPDADHELETLFALSLEMLCIAGVDGRFRRVNPAFERTLGYSADELCARPFVELVHPDDRDATLREIERLRSGRETVSFENRYRTRDGSYRWLSWTAKPQGDRIYASAADVTQRKRAQETLRRSKQRYRQLLEAITTYRYTVEIENGSPACTVHSPGCLAATGYSPDDFRRNPFLWIEMVPEEDRPLVRRVVNEVLCGKEAPPLEHRIVRRDGTIRWIRSTFVLHREDADRLVRYDGLVEDVTERKQAEERFRRLLESAPDATVIVDQSGKIVLVNAQAERVFGWPRDELLGQSVEVLVPGRLRHAHAAHRVAFAGHPHVKGMGERPELSAVRKDGREFPAEISLGPIETDQGLLISCAIRDLTERKRNEKMLRDREVQLLAAQRIQQYLLPHAPPALEGFDIAGAMHPAEFTAGDSFDYIAMPGGAVGIVIGDVAGHGFGSALLMASIHAHLRSFAEACDEVGEALTRTNRALAHEIEQDRFVTLLFGRLDPARRSIEYVNAGHPPGYVLDAEGRIKATLDSTELPLGIDEETRYRSSGSLVLEAGDVVLLLTDGVLEAESQVGEPFGVDRALDLVRRHRDKSAAEMIDALYEAVLAHSAPENQADDITVVIVKVDADRTAKPYLRTYAGL
ncbi:MAG: PAS domain S-box protein [Thermoguttaceae bacterium]|jgi:sigma-B regulation protein RsbU (phosphoserine phosphatase)|nr:PAS domain S-box protein [Thermoguttaceae bacterium]